MLLFFALFAFCKRLRAAIVIVTVLLAWGFGTGWLARPMLDIAQRGYEKTIMPSFAPKTTIVLMGGGTDRRHGELVPKRDSMPRIAAAARLYRQCRESGASCRLILSGGDPQHHGQAEADNYAPYVLAQGVAPADLIRENKSLNTYENAQNVMRILGNAHDNALIVVTSAYHMRRSVRAFEAFGYEPQPYVSDVRENRLTVLPRFRSLENSELALHEVVGLARFHVWRWLHLY
ncbi:conserved hypothetical protein [Burkholderia sp. 8Y]|nr:conserved hypothetical protein [Burkholderia sp. 8Y]